MSPLLRSIKDWLGTCQLKVKRYCSRTAGKRWRKKRIQNEVLFPHYFAWLGSIMHKSKNFYCQVLYSCAEFAIGRNCLVCLSVWRGWKLVLLWFFIFRLSVFTSVYLLTSSLDFPSTLKLFFSSSSYRTLGLSLNLLLIHYLSPVYILPSLYILQNTLESTCSRS